MRRMRGDEGAVAVLVAILSLVLFGFAALVVDAGALYVERRELQNGADAASLAIAQDCAAGECGIPAQTAQSYADSNSRDGDGAYVQDVCGAGAPELAPCSDVPADSVAGAGFVSVKTQTGDENAPGVVPPVLGRALDPSYGGTTVHARAVANWGSPEAMTSALPFAFSNCEWEHYTNSGATYPGTIVAPNWPKNPDGTPAPEAKVFLAGASTKCPGSNSDGDSAGGFGWLGGDGDKCTELTEVDGFIGNKTGLGAAGCDFNKLVGTTVHVPVFDCQTDLSIQPDPDYDAAGKCYGQGSDSGASVRYHVAGYATFYITGISVPGARLKSIVTGQFPCTAVEKCISGYFTTGLAPGGGRVGDGENYGSTVVGLTYVAY